MSLSPHDWTILAKPPVYMNCNSIPMLNENEILLAPAQTRAEFHQLFDCYCLWKYNVNTNVWTKWLTMEGEGDWNTLSLNQDDGILFIFNANYDDLGEIIIVNIKTKQYERFKHDYFDATTSRSLFINGQFHVFGDGKSHFVWDDNKKDLVLVTKELNCSVSNPSILYLKSKQSVLIFPSDGNKIFVYSMNNHKCDILPIELSEKGDFFMWPSCVITKDERIINVFDLKIMEMRVSGVECPSEEQIYHAVIRNDSYKQELSTHGFIHECWNAKEFQYMQYIPFYLIGVVQKFHCFEFVHIMNEDGHWSINVDKIIML